MDLFSGAGGMSLGFEQAGFDVAVAVEYDPIHAAVHAFNFPLTKVVCADASKVRGSDLLDAARDALVAHGVRRWDGRIDCAFGGPPCQSFSTGGQRRIDDERSALLFEFHRLVREVRARTFVMENVPGLLVGEQESLLKKVVRRFRDYSYQVVAPVLKLNAADYGVPQDRERVFVIGSASGEPPPRYPSPTVRPVAKRPGMKRRSADAGLPDGPDVMDAIGDLPDADSFEGLIGSDQVVLDDLSLRALERAASPYVWRLRGVDRDDLSAQRFWRVDVLTSSNRTTHDTKSIARFAKTREGEVEPVSRYYRLARGGLCCTLRAGSGRERGSFSAPRPIHPQWNRVITVREAARLHSFPDWFRFHVTKHAGFRQVGNSVPPLLARAVAVEVVKALGASPSKPVRGVSLGDPTLLALSMSEAAARMAADVRSIPKARRRVQQA